MATELTRQQGFDAAYYLAQKAAALTKSTGQTWTAAQVEVAFAEAGMSPSQHYLLYGYNEGLEPNEFFNKNAYLASKAAAANVTPVEFLNSWKAFSGTNNVFLHYIQYGSFEDGVNPSSGFNDKAYYEAKAALVGNGTTWEQVRDAIKAAGYNAISHYQEFAAAEGNPYTPTPTPAIGQTYTLTTGVDNIVGTSGNDTITGVVDAAANGGTLTPGDVIDGGAGTDTANFVITTAAKWSAGATVKNVENIVFRDVTAAGDTINATNIAGATSFTTSSSTAGQTLTINNIQANAKLGIANSTSAAGVGNGLKVDFKDGTFTTGGTVSADFNAAGAKTAAGVIERSILTVGHSATAGTATDLTLALTATGANYATFTDGAKSIGGLKTITVGGQGSLDIIQSAAEFANVTTVNASANSGGLTIDLTGNNKDVTFTGGAGNDTLTLANFNATDSIDGGAGNDTLNVSLANVLAFTKAAPVKNVETLGITLGGALAANATINGDFFGINNVTINDAFAGGGVGKDTLNLSNLANGTNVTFKASSTAAGTIGVDVKGAVAGTNESATLTFGKAVNFTTSAVTINAAGLETITLATATTSGGGAKVKAIADAQLTTLKFTGSDGITITDALAAGAIKTVDASGVVKDAAGAVGGVVVSLANSTTAVTFTGGQGADNYTASAKGDTITGGLGTDTVTLGAGADKLVYTAAAESDGTIAKDVIGSFTTTADSIQFAASLQQGTAAYIGAAAFTNTGSTQLRMNGADLEVDLNGDGTLDMAITLTGVSAASFGAANFSFA